MMNPSRVPAWRPAPGMLRSLAVVLLSLLGLCRPAAAEYQEYAITDLGIMSGPDSGPYDLNNVGQVVGYTNGHGFLYSGGTMQELPLAPVGINDAGQIVGNVSYSPHAFLYSGGTMHDLGTLAGPGREPTGSRAYAINNAGQVTGASGAYYAPYSDETNIHAFLYSGGTMHDLGSPGGARSYSIGLSINDHGVVVGNATLSTHGTIVAYVSSLNGGPSGGVTLGGTRSGAYGINNAGQIVGWSALPGDTTQHAFLVNGGTGEGMHDLGTLGPGGGSSLAYAINDAGQIVGYADLPGHAGRHAFLYSGGRMRDLNDLVLPGSGWTLTLARDINASGQILGTGINPNGETHGFLLTPVPEPSAVVLGGLGLVGLLVVAARGRRLGTRGVSGGMLTKTWACL